MATRSRDGGYLEFVVPVAVILLFLFASIGSVHSATAVTTITAYKAQYPVKLNGVVEPGEWNDTPQLFEPYSRMTVAFKQNGTGLLFLIEWTESAVCTNQACFAGIELGHLNNTGEMGSPTTPTIMALVSPSFKGNVTDFISTADQTPTPVESYGYRTQSVCGLTLVGQSYTAECYRPFALRDASPYDFNLTVGSTVEIGFAVGEYTIPGEHDASDMLTYVLSISNQTWTAPQTTSVSTGVSQSATTTQSTSLPAVPVSWYALVQQYGPYLPLAAIVIAAIHFVRRRGWTGESPW